MAERTGLEPATPGVTGRYSNRLSYRSALNNYPAKGSAKPSKTMVHLVGADGLEPPTPAL